MAYTSVCGPNSTVINTLTDASSESGGSRRISLPDQPRRASYQCPLRATRRAELDFSHRLRHLLAQCWIVDEPPESVRGLTVADLPEQRNDVAARTMVVAAEGPKVVRVLEAPHQRFDPAAGQSRTCS